MGDKDDVRDIDLEWKNRVLCSDESCIGTIGADGICRECGKPYEGELPDGFDASDGEMDSPSTDVMDDDIDDYLEADDDDEDTDGDQDPATDDEWARRILCSDESCIGVIDEKTGRCKECGKPYKED